MDESMHVAPEREWDRWADWPTTKVRQGVQHAVAALLDTLAPEQPPPKRDATAVALQRLRSPRGCILQGARCAVSVSWFPAAATDRTLGELQIVVWRGVVSRPGAAQRARSGAVALHGEVLVPIADGPRDWAWRGDNGDTYTADTLTQRCHSLLGDATPTAPAAEPVA